MDDLDRQSTPTVVVLRTNYVSIDFERVQPASWVALEQEHCRVLVFFGRRMRQEFAVSWVRENGHVETNPEGFADWLLEPAVKEAQTIPDREQTKQWFEAAEQATDRRLGEISNVDLHPENRQWVSGGWCEPAQR